MSKQSTTCYTVRSTSVACYQVSFAQAPAFEIETFDVSWSSPDVASSEFKAQVDPHACYLSPHEFEKRIDKLSRLYHAERQKLVSWQAMAQGGTR